ncbi:MAG TPA: DNA polymerase ligase N-terminal domain-containing protein [Solirubrobacterales bacterium]|nr:DNA polymerase ligase N-terminal domain-containing protein [Solirubrobacterales bacterium]
MTSSDLGDYRAKRDFESTPEPSPRRRRRKGGAPRFVVQEHSARRLHWDLRLEHDGVAVSWAIPNGIPADPQENRRAVHTEDHPLEYLGFEGEIPAGEYGAGTVRIWDQGTFECLKWERGKVVFAFEGDRLSGRYALFQAGDEKDWMIHRMDPPAELRDPFPESIAPMLPRPARLPRKGKWAAEVRWQGLRAIASGRPGRLRLSDSDGGDISRRYPKVRRLARQLGTRDAVLDGELVVFDEEGRPSAPGRKGDAVTYVIFDLLYLEGHDLMAEPYRRRRKLLEGLELSGEAWQTPSYSVGDLRALLDASHERGLPGLILKRLDSRYEPGRRADSWRSVG